jgi:hypothetical protein
MDKNNINIKTNKILLNKKFCRLIILFDNFKITLLISYNNYHLIHKIF